MDNAFPREIASRGFRRIDDVHGLDDDLPGYLYRDYGFMYWDNFETYVSEVVRKYIGSDEDIKNDRDIQRWAYEICNPSYGNVKGFPCKIDTQELLIDILTNTIFTCTINHAAVNSGHFDAYGFVPNRPLKMRKPMPDDLEVFEDGYKYIVDSLPDFESTMQQMNLTYILSERTSTFDFYSSNLLHIEHFLVSLWDEQLHHWSPVYIDEWNILTHKLQDITADMKRINSLYKYDYYYLLGTQISPSVDI